MSYKHCKHRSAGWYPNYFDDPPPFSLGDEVILDLESGKVKISLASIHSAPLVASGGAFGPAHDMQLNFAWTVGIGVAANVTLQMGFGYSAWWENATEIYDQNYAFLVERGNYGRSSDDFVIGPRKTAYYFFVTGWNKQSPPDADYGWLQSEYIGTDKPQPNVGIVKFRDGGGVDHNVANQTVVLRAT